MLLCRLKKRNKYLFLCELLLLSACGHGILGLCLFVMYQGAHSAGLHIDVSAKKSRRPVLFISCKRPSMFMHGAVASSHVHGASGQAIGGMRSGSCSGRVRRQGSTTSVISPAPKTVEKNLTVSSSQSKAESKALSAQQKQQAKAALKKAEAQKKLAKKVVQEAKKEVVVHKPAKPKEPEKVPAQKQAKIEPVPVPVSQVAKTEPKKESLPQQITPVPVQEVAPLAHVNNVQVPLPNEPVAPEFTNPEADGNGSMQEAFAGQLIEQDGYGEYEDYEYVQQEKMRDAIITELESRWKPPRGLSKELECEMRICVGQGGKVVECIIDKPSGVLIYDMAARVAARAMSLPRWAWGKEFAIAFRQ